MKRQREVATVLQLEWNAKIGQMHFAIKTNTLCNLKQIYFVIRDSGLVWSGLVFRLTRHNISMDGVQDVWRQSC